MVFHIWMSEWKTKDGEKLSEYVPKEKSIPRQVKSKLDADAVSATGGAISNSASTVSLWYTIVMFITSFSFQTLWSAISTL